MARTFSEIIDQYPAKWIDIQLKSVDMSKVKLALNRAKCHQRLFPENLIALLSPKAEAYLEDMADLSFRITQQRFGRVIQMYTPLYLSNHCVGGCTYCGFNKNNKIERTSLTEDQILEEAKFLHQKGFRHILLVSGDDPRYVNTETLINTAKLIRHLFSSITIEVQPLKTEQYLSLVEAGIEGVTVYQETYCKEVYSKVHLGGIKKNYNYRLETPERAGNSGMRRIGIGALLGLSDWRYDVFYTGLHAQFLEQKFWKSHISVSFPRLRDAFGKDDSFEAVSDKNFVQLLTALRLYLPNAGMVLSTREASDFRDHVFILGITQMSAGSKTTPGGYSEEKISGAQFEIEDKRSVDEVAKMIQQNNYEPVWKDWEPSLSTVWEPTRTVAV